MTQDIKNGTEQGQFVIFRLDNEKYGADVECVNEIVTMQKITKVPGTHRLIEGIINLRGHIVPVFNLRGKFGLPERKPTRSSRIIVVETDGSAAGIIVDEVTEVIRLNGEEIELPPSSATTVDAGYIKGIAKLDQGLVTLLDLKKILAEDRGGDNIAS